MHFLWLITKATQLANFHYLLILIAVLTLMNKITAQGQQFKQYSENQL